MPPTSDEKRKVRHEGVVHYAGNTIWVQVGVTPTGNKLVRFYPIETYCRVRFEHSNETPADFENAEDAVVTCVACLGARRPRRGD